MSLLLVGQIPKWLYYSFSGFIVASFLKVSKFLLNEHLKGYSHAMGWFVLPDLVQIFAALINPSDPFNYS